MVEDVDFDQVGQSMVESDGCNNDKEEESRRNEPT